MRRRIQFNSIQFYLYSAFYNTGLSQSSFTKGPGLRPPQSKPRVTVARKNSLIRRKKPPNGWREEEKGLERWKWKMRRYGKQEASRGGEGGEGKGWGGERAER